MIHLIDLIAKKYEESKDKTDFKRGFLASEVLSSSNKEIVLALEQDNVILRLIDWIRQDEEMTPVSATNMKKVFINSFIRNRKIV